MEAFFTNRKRAFALAKSLTEMGCTIEMIRKEGNSYTDPIFGVDSYVLYSVVVKSSNTHNTIPKSWKVAK